MNDPLLVRGLERVRDLPGHGERFFCRNRPRRDPLRERLALDELENERLDVARFLETVDRRNVGMVQRREDLGLPLEPRQPLGILRHRLWQHLDRHLAVQLPVLRPVHLPHASRAERRQDLVGTETGTR